MSGGHKTIESRRAEIDANRDQLTAGPDRSVFYTSGGRDRAEELAAERGKTTLEQTTYGQKLEKERLYFPGGRADWDEASRAYAQQAEGDVTVVVGPDGKGKIQDQSTFAQVERDELLRNEKVRKINGLDRQELADLKPGEADRYIEQSSAIEMDKEMTQDQRQQEQRRLQEQLDRDAARARERNAVVDPSREKQPAPDPDPWGDKDEPDPWAKDAEKGKDKAQDDPDPWGDKDKPGPRPGGGRQR